jgi:hypothetical protein
MGLPAPLRLVRQVPLASRSCVGGGNGALGRAGPRLYAGRAGKPAAGHRARLATLGICCTAPKSRSKATIRVKGGCGRQADGTAGLPPVPEIPRAFQHLRFVLGSDVAGLV